MPPGILVPAENLEVDRNLEVVTLLADLVFLLALGTSNREDVPAFHSPATVADVILVPHITPSPPVSEPPTLPGSDTGKKCNT